MNPEFDVIIVGSGPAGISAAFPLAEAGLKLLMVDGGQQPNISHLDKDYIFLRTSDSEQWKWMVGENFYALKMHNAISPKLRVPHHAFVFNGFQKKNNIESVNFNTIGSLAAGGLSNSWGCGVACYSKSEFLNFPFPFSEIEQSYAAVSLRMGVSGRIQDDLSEYFGLDQYSQLPIEMDSLHSYLSKGYSKKRRVLNSQGFRMGRSRVAALSEDMAGRKACNLSGNCLWGCNRKSLYNASDELPSLLQNKNFNKISGFIVEKIRRLNGYWCIEGRNVHNDMRKLFSAKKIVLAAGTLATTKIVLDALDLRKSVQILSCPTANFMLWLPKKLGSKREKGFGLGQLSFTLNLSRDITSFGSTFATTGIPVTEFLRHVPMCRPYGINLSRNLLSSCAVGNIFLPGHLSSSVAKLDHDGVLRITGSYKPDVANLMDESLKKLRKSFWHLGAVLLTKSFTVSKPGSDIHYAGTIPMKKTPTIGKTSEKGEVIGLEDVFIVDGACLPILPEKSHTLTVMANADRIGKFISSTFKRVNC